MGCIFYASSSTPFGSIPGKGGFPRQNSRKLAGHTTHTHTNSHIAEHMPTSQNKHSKPKGKALCSTCELLI